MPPAPRHRRLALAAVLSAVLLGTGCTATVSGTPTADPAPAPTEGPGSDPVLWVDRVCGSLLTFTGPALAQPQFGDSPNLPGIKQKLTDYLNGIITGLQQSRSQLGQVGRSPVGGGDEAVTRINDVLTKLETDITAAKAKVDSADPDDPQEFLATITDAETQLGKISAPDALADLSASPRLQKAAAKAANCQQLSAQNSSHARLTGLSDLERVFYGAPRVPRVTAVALLRRRPRRRGRATSRACCAARDRSCASAPVTPHGCRSCSPTPPGACRRRHLRRGRHRRARWPSPRAARPRCAPRSAATSSASPGLDDRGGQDGAGGNAARRGRVAGVDARGRPLGRSRCRSAARSARPADAPGADRRSHSRRHFPSSQWPRQRVADHRSPACGTASPSWSVHVLGALRRTSGRRRG